MSGDERVEAIVRFISRSLHLPFFNDFSKIVKIFHDLITREIYNRIIIFDQIRAMNEELV